MKVKLIVQHDGEGQFPTFLKGTPVTLTGGEDEHFLHWFPCEIDGHKTYIPESFMQGSVLMRDYNPTELVQNKGDVLEVVEIINSWLVATNDKGQLGFVPAESVVSI